MDSPMWPVSKEDEPATQKFPLGAILSCRFERN
jgi:hypothetical protein